MGLGRYRVEAYSAAPLPPGWGRIVLTRRVQFIGGNRRFRVLVDGVIAGYVRELDTVALPVPAGPHEIQVRFDFSRSKPTPVAVASGADVKLSCGFVGGALGAVVLQVVRPHRSLALALQDT